MRCDINSITHITMINKLYTRQEYNHFSSCPPLTFAVPRDKISFQYVVDENSPILYKRITYTMHAVGENSPMTLT